MFAQRARKSDFATKGKSPKRALLPDKTGQKWGQTMSGKALGLMNKLKFPLSMASIIALSACDENGGFSLAGSGRADANAVVTTSSQNTQLVERDVEAPEAFQLAETGLWDGRPSLGGVWVAHPDVNEPERVIIRNEANGTSVVGALFRRERENPGPPFQVSSDAANALQMLAGAPTVLQVTALRREETPEPVEQQPVSDFEPPADIAAAPIESAPLDTVDPIAGAAAAIDAVDPIANTAATATVGAVDAVDPIAGAAAAIDTAEGVIPNARAADDTIDTFDAIEGTGPIADAAPVEPAVFVVPESLKPLIDAYEPPAIEEPAILASSALTEPYIQLGVFSVEDNAISAADKMRASGVTPDIREQVGEDRTTWRVLIGPAITEAERAELLLEAQAQGFSDAHFASN